MVSSEKERIMSHTTTSGIGSTGADSGPRGGKPAPGRRLGAVLVWLLFTGLSVAVMLTGRVGTGESADQINYHLPVIRMFAQQLPTPHLAKYDSATTPGYHLVMSALWNFTGAGDRWASTPKAPVGAGPTPEYPGVMLDDAERAEWEAFVRALLPLQVLNILLSAMLPLTVYLLASRYTAWWVAAALTLPLAMNQYVLGASIWLTTDNIGWWLALSALGSAVVLSCTGGAARAGVWASAAVFVRQVHLWVCGPIFAAGLLAWLMGRRETRNRTLLATVLACTVPTLIVGAFVWLWGGLTPPSERIREVHGHGTNPAAVALALSLFGAYGVVFFGAWRDELSGILRRPAVPLAVALVALLLGVAFATSTQQPTLTDPPMRGYGWLWRLSGMFPAIKDRSILLAVGAPVGALMLCVMLRAAAARGHARQATILTIGLGCWLAAQVVNPAAWQRYFDPIVLTAVIWIVALATPTQRLKSVTAGAVVLALLMSGLAYRSIWRDLAKNELPFDGGVLKMQGKLAPKPAPDLAAPASIRP